MGEFARDEVHIGYGKHLYWCNLVDGEIPAEPTWNKVAGTKVVNAPESELGAAEITNDDTPNFTKDYIPSMYEPGTASFTYVYTATQYAELEDVFLLASDPETRGDAVKGWKEIIAEGTDNESTKVWKGFLTKHPLPIEGEEAPEVEAEMQATTLATYTPSEGAGS